MYAFDLGRIISCRVFFFANDFPSFLSAVFNPSIIYIFEFPEDNEESEDLLEKQRVE